MITVHDTTLLPPLQATNTLLVTDMVVKVEDEVPEIVCEDPRPLLFHARDNALERVEDTPDVRLKGWRRIVQVGGKCKLAPTPGVHSQVVRGVCGSSCLITFLVVQTAFNPRFFFLGKPGCVSCPVCPPVVLYLASERVE